ncbi:ATP-binding cassette domain-containing protein [Nocardiopsis alborubida]|uniref:ATP-binding cassette domain-containing protein n=1 Tax=Nocardiopsis alborubida TaxID=146802 RepID=A0A7X6RPV9_9ACTN|nr:ATP-binding cassette domain-containing protein [Nocardiopsis alborubida]NKY98018.1 ATP-binding cassette domain-containing protein [Nocardiopsis alborubida]
MAEHDLAVLTEGLRKTYGDKRALDGLDMAVPRGTVHGILGPNGAGKTTLVRTLATLLGVEEGRARVAGFDLAAQPGRVRRRIGLLGQHAAVDEELSGRQNLEMFGRLHHLSGRRAAARAGELLERFGLADTGRKPVSAYSGGMRRRLDLAASLIVDPDVLFLDEPTTGLDPRGRGEVWSAVRSLVGGGTTVLLTTQYLEEADQLADRVCVVDGGRVIADGTPDQLKAVVGGDRVDVVLRAPDRLGEAVGVLRGISASGRVDTDADARRVSAPVADRMGALNHVVRALGKAGIEAEDLAVRRPTLDEVFLHLTGDSADGAGDSGRSGDPGAAEPPPGERIEPPAGDRARSSNGDAEPSGGNRVATAPSAPSRHREGAA